MNQPVFITGVERSGSSLIAKILDISGIFKGNISKMYENENIIPYTGKYISHNLVDGDLFLKTDHMTIPVNWKLHIDTFLKNEGYKDGLWMLKSSMLAQTWPLWHYAYPNARWLIVRRRTGDVIQSCMKTGFMRTFKEEENLRKIDVQDEREGWKWWVHQYEKKFVEMIEAGVNCKIVWPERMVTGDYQQIYETLEWLGMKWNTRIVEVIDPMLNKSRRKENGVLHNP
jgi:hypothetical protein